MDLAPPVLNQTLHPNLDKHAKKQNGNWDHDPKSVEKAL